MKISELIMNKVNKDYLLPSIQREFVWLTGKKEKKIPKFFDSIMQEYPIGMILTWGVIKKPTEKLKCAAYTFTENYDKDKPYNTLANTNGFTKIFLFLDGQQRVSALNIGLRGSYNYSRLKNKYSEKLYLNLFADLENDPDNNYGLKYHFEFRMDDTNNSGELWFEVGRVLDFRDKTSEDFKDEYDKFIEKATKDQNLRKTARNILGQLHKVICSDDVIIEKIITTDSDEKILNIFVRTNDGGVKLEKSDLLLSYMESDRTLFGKKGARKEIVDFVTTLNKEKLHKPDYRISKDDILKTALVLSGIAVQYKLENFNPENLKKISNNWNNIKNYLTLTVNLIAKYGFMRNNIASHNSLIPIAYYLLNKKSSQSFIDSHTVADIELKNEIIKWFVTAQLTGAFGGSSDTTLKNFRDEIKAGKSISKINMGNKITKEDVKKWIEKEAYKSRYSQLILMLLTENTYWEECHQDHIHPKSNFNTKVYKDMKLSPEDIEFYEDHANSIVNLHLLNPSVNIKKGAQTFSDWATKQNKGFLEASCIPVSINPNFNNFRKFIGIRKEILIKTLFDKLS